MTCCRVASGGGTTNREEVAGRMPPVLARSRRAGCAVSGTTLISTVCGVLSEPQDTPVIGSSLTGN
jgi:hypothetical protein